MRRHVIVTGVRNQSHLVHVSSYLRHLLDGAGPTATDRLGVSYVGGGRTLGRIAVPESEVARLLPDDDRLELDFPTGAGKWRFPADARAAYVAVGAPGLKPYARMLAANRGRRIPVVVTDEGIGTYGDWRTRRDAWARQGVPQPWRTVRSLAVSAGERTLTTQRWAMYRKDGSGRWRLDDLVGGEFRRRCPPVDPEPEFEDVVMLTQPWTLLGVVGVAAYRTHLDELAAEAAADRRRLVIRPHPAEDPELYKGFPLLTGGILAELDPEVVAARAVIGGPSTALLNLAALYGMPARLVDPPGLRLWDQLGPRQRELFDTFVRWV